MDLIYQKPSVEDSSHHEDGGRSVAYWRLETVHLHGFGGDGETGLLVGQEGANIVALVALELDDISNFFVVHDGTIAGEFLLDDLEDLLEIKFAGDAGHGGQGLATISLLDADLKLQGQYESDEEYVVTKVREEVAREPPFADIGISPTVDSHVVVQVEERHDLNKKSLQRLLLVAKAVLTWILFSAALG